ncbi:hypothetical protein [Flagellimonas sp. CMM7]|uniref:hypothetical protein n=1 Tax=Flagellimonas sp. CMM7 TaxID=2654676 RepID=UPI001969DB2C|nr:hypothetical protein [Flagellimonas sp. CMM7]UII81504.1 hypothetical protein LV704_08285 [Flagellimonas sp. CMM7]
MNELEKFPLKIKMTSVLANQELDGNEKIVLLALFMDHKRKYSKKITRISEDKFEKDTAIDWELLLQVVEGLQQKELIVIEGTGVNRYYRLNYELLEKEGLIQMKR